MPPIAVFVALADPTRCRIIEILHAGPQPVHVLAGYFAISRPAISRHLRVLRQAGLISEKKIGRENRYGLHANRLKPIQDWLVKLAPAPKAASRPKPAPVPTTPIADELPVSAPAGSKARPGSAPPKPIPLAKAAPVRREPAALSQMGFDF